MIDGETVTLNGIAKGSGMIAPDMATMLAYFFTDLPIKQELLQKLVSKAVEKTFNCISVDGDTSTSDTVLVFATGKADITPITDEKDNRLRAFNRILVKQLKELALAIVKDGEGISKFVTIKVKAAKGKRAAKRIGLSIANSPLVKTAIAGEDPNWGRIVMAVGKSGEAADRDKLNIWIGGHQVTSEGARVHNYDEAPLAEYMKGRNIVIEVDIGLGRGRAEVWTCDLTHDYISINADYRS
jgi:glutamate N-acetyltransferase/amino-acid N-acetyltransferase